MSFQCPQCLAPSSLEIIWSLSLPPDIRSDEICLQVVRCTACDFRGLAVYEETRRGPLDAEHWDHLGYRASPGLALSIETALRGCHDPVNPDCSCAAHRNFGQVDAQGRWINPAVQAGVDNFAMIHFNEEEQE